MTSACSDVVYIGIDEPDLKGPVSNLELVDSLRNRTRELEDEERSDEDVYPHNAFGI